MRHRKRGRGANREPQDNTTNRPTIARSSPPRNYPLYICSGGHPSLRSTRSGTSCVHSPPLWLYGVVSVRVQVRNRVFEVRADDHRWMVGEVKTKKSGEHQGEEYVDELSLGRPAPLTWIEAHGEQTW